MPLAVTSPTAEAMLFTAYRFHSVPACGNLFDC